MGNCLVKSPKENVTPPLRNSPKGFDDDEAPKQLVVESTKKKQYEEDNEDNDKHSGNNKDVKRAGQRAVKKLKVGNEAPPPDQLFENFKKTNRQKTNNDTIFIINALKSHFVFYNLSDNELERIVEKMFYCELGSKEFVFKQGDNASSYLIVEKGSLEVIVNEKTVRTLKSGEGFGELALLYGAPRSASIRTLENCGFWGIDRHTFRRAVEEMVVKETDENRKFIEGVRFFNTMTSEQKDAIAGVLISQKFGKGQTIVNEGDQADSFYILKEGSVQVLKGGKEVRKMFRGDSFGEQALYYHTTRGATVKAIDPTICLALGREILTKILGDQVQIITFRNLQKWALERNALLSQLTKIQIEKIVEAMKISNYKQNDIVAKKGSLCSAKIIICIEGSVKKGKSGSNFVKKGDLFGDEFIKKENRSKTFDEELTMESEGVLAEISYDTFSSIIGGSIEDALKKSVASHEKKLMKQENNLKKIAADIKLEELVFFKKLGFGQFGSVYLVKHKKEDAQFFALKCVSKQQVVEQSLEKHLQQEKSVLEAVNFPFIMQFIRTYKDQNNIYFLVEYIKGLELWDVIREIGLLSTQDSQFYIGSLILAVEYLHTQQIIYRDIKPENIMVEATGYLKMIDMGTAKFLKGKSPGGNRTFTIIGTPHYMAPEIITGKGYTLAVDLWSIGKFPESVNIEGICLYEFMCGMVPFGEEAEDPYDIYEEIIKHPIRYPGFLKDKKARRLMDQLINKTAEVRLGGSFAALKAHPWFEDFDWDKLLDKELKAPYLPPKDKMMTENEIKKMESLSKKVITEIEEEQKSSGKKYKKEMAEDPNWDKNF